MSHSLPVNTPCIGLCSTVFGDTTCRGCLRFVHEIIDWNRYTDEQKQLIWQRLNDHVQQILPQFISIHDPKQLENWVLQHRLPWRFDNIWRNVYEVLRFAERRQLTLTDCGFAFRPNCQLDELNKQLYALASAHYERNFLRAQRVHLARQR